MHFSLGEEQNKMEISEHQKIARRRLIRKKTRTVGCNLTVQREENTDSSARESAGGCSGIAFAASEAKPKPTGKALRDGSRALRRHVPGGADAVPPESAASHRAGLMP